MLKDEGNLVSCLELVSNMQCSLAHCKYHRKEVKVLDNWHNHLLIDS